MVKLEFCLTSGTCGVFCLPVHDENIHIRIKDVCERGVDVVIDFVSSIRTVNCVTKVLNKARNLFIDYLNFASSVRYCLLLVHLLSHMAVHLHHLHCHHFHLLSLVHSFILNLRLRSVANPFHHRPFPYLPHWFYGLSAHLTFLFCSTAGFVCTVCMLD